MSDMKTPFYYSEALQGYSLGKNHPFKPVRYLRTYELLKGYGVFGEDTPVLEPNPAPEERLEAVHSRDYLDALKRASRDPDDPARMAFGLGPGDTPAFAGMWEAALLCAGASLDGADEIASGRCRRAYNVAGGLHHAHKSRASGFCIINDAAVAIHRLLETKRRVVYLDIDAHHGDGVQGLFYFDPRVLTISLHESGRWLYPGTGFPDEIGVDEGRGMSINVPFAPNTDDETFLWAFSEVVPRALAEFKPNAIVTQFGADAHFGDPLAHLALTTRSYEEILVFLQVLNIPWLALGGGGYNMETVPRIWSMVYAAQADFPLPDELPESYRAKYGGDRLRDDPIELEGADEHSIRAEAEKAVSQLGKALEWD